MLWPAQLHLVLCCGVHIDESKLGPAALQNSSGMPHFLHSDCCDTAVHQQLQLSATPRQCCPVLGGQCCKQCWSFTYDIGKTTWLTVGHRQVFCHDACVRVEQQTTFRRLPSLQQKHKCCPCNGAFCGILHSATANAQTVCEGRPPSSAIHAM